MKWLGLSMILLGKQRHTLCTNFQYLENYDIQQPFCPSGHRYHNLYRSHFDVTIHFNRQCLISKQNAIRYLRPGTHYYIQCASEFRRVIHLVMCCISSFFYSLVLQRHELHITCWLVASEIVKQKSRSKSLVQQQQQIGG